MVPKQDSSPNSNTAVKDEHGALVSDTLTLSQAHESVSPFSKLPRELRDYIYDELWKDTPCLQSRRSGSTTVAVYKVKGAESFDRRAQDLPIWLLTSKLILEEAMEQFHRCSEWSTRAGVYGQSGLFMPRSLLIPTTASMLSLPTVYLGTRNVGEPILEKEIMIWEPSAAWITSTLDRRIPSNTAKTLWLVPHNVQTLRINLVCGMMWPAHWCSHCNIVDPEACDFSELRGLVASCPKLEKLVVTAPEDLGGELVSVVVSAISEEVRKWGDEYIGGEFKRSKVNLPASQTQPLGEELVWQFEYTKGRALGLKGRGGTTLHC
ncbi:hypothetical protein K505DRAFT_327376 [Melanomma pulvis-pyrius CBS 109.77]|uniref:Uncharacterized protein n=1 Tax=Melanomma pulvis-pyrius CBS 109.77 TaxID=1314802 RepID=A0A6A6X3M2_9PLEO|nr:hypothetical protein K505DRAFT_327376 [Melanomma pulvis-pyrius CBS 109.77]